MTGKIKSGGGTWFVLAAATLWGTTGTAQALAPEGAGPLAVGTMRLLIGGIGLMAITLLQGGFGRVSSWPIRLSLGAGFFMALYQVTFFAGVSATGVAVGTIVGIGSSPVAAGFLALVFRGERPGRRWLVATALALSGCSLLALSGGEGVRVDILGVFLAICAGASYAACTLLIKGMLERQSPTPVMTVVFCLGALMLLPLLLFVDIAWIGTLHGVATVFYFGLVTAALAYWLFARGLRSVQVASAVTLTLAEPMTAGLLGLLLLGEQMNAQAYCGIGLIFCGLVLLALPVRSRYRSRDRDD